jgi:lipopolysaccharide biosynthesis regulator YciM
MEFEIWWLLGIPLFFTSGWLAARIDIRQLLSSRAACRVAILRGQFFTQRTAR